MPSWNRKLSVKTHEEVVLKSRSSLDKEKEYRATVTASAEEKDVQHSHAGYELSESESQLHRGLKSRQITMIALGGALGTGLIIATGSALAKAGPAPVLLSYAFVGAIVYVVMCALGEMATWLPLPSGFTGYATRFVDPALGFALGYTYWIKYIIVTPTQLTVAALVLQYWVPRTKVNPGVFITMFLVAIVAINYFGIRFFGEIEFWMSSLKVIIVVGLILLNLVLALGGGPDRDRKGFRYWQDPGAFNTYIEGWFLLLDVPCMSNLTIRTADGPAGRFLAFWSVITVATFAYIGIELVGVTVGEAQNPRRTIPRAIRLTFFRILFFYVLSVLLLGMLVPYNSPDLVFATTQSNSASASPFVVAIKLSGIKALPGIMNACILVFVFSASNSDLYIASRTLFGLAREGRAPRIFARTDRRGVPIYALGLSAAFAMLAFMNISDDSKVVFGYFMNLITVLGLLAWISILVTHIYFRRARKAQGIRDEDLVYVSPVGSVGSYIALGLCILIALFKNFDAFVHNPKTYGNFDVKNFVTGYIGIPLYLFLILGYKLTHRGSGVRSEDADLFSGKDAIDKEEEAFLVAQALERQSGEGNWFYRTFVAWLF